jgi:hypothetical protein
MTHPPSFTTILVILAVGVLVFPWMLDELEKTTWKRLEYLTLCFVALGLIPATIDSQHWFQANELKSENEIVDMNAGWIVSYLGSAREGGCGPTANTSSFKATENVDAICQWLAERQSAITGSVKKHERITPEMLGPLPNPSTRFTPDVKALVERYNGNVDALASYQKQVAMPGPMDDFNNLVRVLSTAFGPYFLVMALVLKVSQIHADIKREKVAASTKASVKAEADLQPTTAGLDSVESALCAEDSEGHTGD